LLLWDLASGRSLRRFTGHGDTPWSVAIGPNGDRAFSGGQDKNLILWDMETGTSIHNYEGADSYGPYGVDKYETEVTISPDGETAISGEPDGTVLKWQLTEPSMADLVTWIGNNRYLRELTCQERSVYQIQPLCDEKDQTTATTADLLTAVHEVVISLPEATDPLRSTGPAKPLITLSTIMNPAQILHTGQNRGQLSTNEIDVWNYTGTAGEILSLQMVADQPVDTFANDLAIIEERIAAGQLDAVLIVIDPEGKLIGMNIESFTDDGEFNSDAILDVPLSMDGEYQIQARSERDFYGGDYTLVVESKLFTMDPETLASFAGEWYEEESGLTIVYTVGDGRLTYEVSNGYAGYIVFVGEVEFIDPVFPFKGVYTLDETGYPVESIITWPFDGSISHTYRVEE
jgi:hypothetical protein